MPTIKMVNFGIANSYPQEDVIELHKGLDDPEFSQLKEKILAHEMEHIRKKSKGFWKQREVDFKTDLRFKELLPFIKKYPKSILQFSPIIYSKEKNTLLFDFSLIFLYIIYAGILVLIYFLINLFSTNSIFFWKIVKYSGIVLGIVIVLSFIGKKLKRKINEESSKLTSKK